MPIQNAPIPQRKYHRLAIEWNGGAVKIGRVQFHKQQFFVQLVDQPRTNGAIFNGEMEAGVLTKTFEYTALGYVTSHLVKYSHAANGFCHFSQTEKVDGHKVFAWGTRLDTGRGHIFSLILGGLERFAPVVHKDQRELVTVCSFNASRPPPLIYLVCHWAQPDEIRPGVPLYNPIGPLNNLGNEGYGVAVAPTPESPLAGRLLIIQPVFRIVDLSIEGHPFQSALIAGFSRVPESETQHFIGLTYPASNAVSMPSIDLTGSLLDK